MSETSAGNPQPEAIPLNMKVRHFVLLFLPHFLEAPKGEGYCSQSERLHSRREPNGSRAEPRKQKPRSCSGAGISSKRVSKKRKAGIGDAPKSVPGAGESIGAMPKRRHNLRLQRSLRAELRGIGNETRLVHRAPDREEPMNGCFCALPECWRYHLSHRSPEGDTGAPRRRFQRVRIAVRCGWRLRQG